MNDRIGTIGKDGARHWPALTVTGRAYTRPAHTLDIGEGCFVVYDAFPSEDTPALIEALKATLTHEPAEPDKRTRRA